MQNCFFESDDNEWFKPTPHTRGPWHEDHCHAGPPTGLIARAFENLTPDQKLVRLTVNLMRPIPFAGFRVNASIIRSGRIVSTSSAELVNEDGKVCASATGLHMTPQPAESFATQNSDYGKHTDATIGRFPIGKTLHGKPAFNGDGVIVKYPDGQSHEPGPTIAWMKTVPLLAGETPSPFQKLCPLADCGNAFGRNAEPWDVNFMNPDLTILLHRDCTGDWLGSNSTCYWEDNGIGMSDAQLFDETGTVGRALQTLLLRKSGD